MHLYSAHLPPILGGSGSKTAYCLSPTDATAVELTQPATVISEMAQAALNRMAQSISQLTLCQVTGEEIATATKLLEKACQKLRGISEVPPQRIIDLDNATRQLHQLSWILDSCTITASYEVSQAQKALLLLPVPKKDLARLLKNMRGFWVAPEH